MTLHGRADSKEDAKEPAHWLDHVGAGDLTDEVLEKHRIGSRRLKG
jgi:hypothetical protein